MARAPLLLVSTGAGDWLLSGGELTPVEGGYRLTARKSYAIGCLTGDVLVTSARLGSEVLHFGLPMSSEGVRVEPDWHTLGMRATGSHSLVIEDAFVPGAAVSLRRPAGEWHPVWSVILSVALPFIMAAYVGAADRAADLAIEGARGSTASVTAAAEVGELLLAHTAADSTRCPTRSNASSSVGWCSAWIPSGWDEAQDR